VAPVDVGAYEALGLAANPGWRITAGFKVAGSGGGGSDTSSPSVAVTSPAVGAGPLSGTVPLAAAAADNVAVAGVQFRLDGTPLGAEVTAAPYTMAWDSTLVSNGTHSLTAVARDASGNSATSSAVTLTIANTTSAPAPPASPPPDANSDGGGGCTTGPIDRLDPLLLAYCALSLLVLTRRRAGSGRHPGTGRVQQQVEVGMQGDRHPEPPAALQARTEQQ
jgi:hypothetical protein